jgi:tight adherence protein B
MSAAVLFIVLLALTFGVMMFAMRRTRSEKVVQERLQAIEKSADAKTEDTSNILKQEALSDVAWLNDIMQGVSLFTRLQRFIEQAESRWTVGQLVIGSLLVAVCGTWIATYWVPVLALAALIGLALGASPYVYLYWKRVFRFRKFEELLPDTIDLMARALRAGHTVSSAIEMISEEVPSPVGPEFRRVFEEQNFGLPLRDSLLNLTHRVPIEDVQFLVTAILVQKETGGNLAEVLDKTTQVIRDRFRIRGQLRVYTAQGRLTGWILAGLPFFMFFALSMISPDYTKLLLTDPLGQKMIYAGLILMALGAYFIRRIVNIRV